MKEIQMTPEELFLKNRSLVYKVYSDCVKESEFIKFYKDDIIQEGMIALWKAANRYDPDKSKFSTFAYLAIRNRMWCVIRDINKNKNIVPLSSLVYDNEDESEPVINITIIQDPSNQYLLIEIEDIVESVIKSVGRNCETIIQMSLNGYTQEEISKQVNTSQGNVSRVLKQFRKVFKENYLNKEK